MIKFFLGFFIIIFLILPYFIFFDKFIKKNKKYSKKTALLNFIIVSMIFFTFYNLFIMSMKIFYGGIVSLLIFLLIFLFKIINIKKNN